MLKNLAPIVVAFANADGGDVVIGVEDDGRITGVNQNQKHLNELLRVPFDYCTPSVNADAKFIDCNDFMGNPNRVLVMHIPQSPDLHTNQADEAFYRVGDKSKKLNFEQRMQLFYAKGKRYFEDAPVFDATIADINLDLVQAYCKKIGYTKKPETFLRTNRNFIQKFDGTEKISGAAILLFGKDPQKFFPRARIRIVRFEGDEERFGREMNVVKDIEFKGTFLEMTKSSLDFIATQIKEYTFLGSDANFRTTPQYPKFCWTELIVNAVVHRDYSIMGTDIIVKIFDNHLIVESPGILPGMVRLNNIRQIHFSRNPKIAQYMHDYELVKEFGEGVDRMFREMEAAGNPAPEYRQYDFMLKATLISSHNEKSNDNNEDGKGGQTNTDNTIVVLQAIVNDPYITRIKLSELTGIAPSAVQKHINKLKKQGIIKRNGGDFGGHWEILEKK